MWLDQFHRHFQTAAERFTGRRQDLDAVERAVAPARKRMEVGPEALRAIEGSGSWSYAAWWPRLSSALEAAVPLPASFRDDKARAQGVRVLYDRLKHIEVVSVVLRFLHPEEFGIISPPVVSLLGLVPADDHVDTYLRYTAVLRGLADHYKVLLRVADVDMALWSAALLSLEPEFAGPTTEMNADAHFQEIRLRNVAAGFGRHSRWSDAERIVLARVLAEHDHLTAALLAARVLEGLLYEISGRSGIRALPRKGQSEAGSLARGLDGRPEVLRLGVEAGTLPRLWNWRNEAIHGEPGITRTHARSLVQEVSELWSIFGRRAR